MATTFTRAAIAPFGAITVHRIITAVSDMAANLQAKVQIHPGEVHHIPDSIGFESELAAKEVEPVAP